MGAIYKTVIKNRFRVRDAQGKIIKLNTSYSNNGTAVSVEGFDSYAEAEGAIYLYTKELPDSGFKIETYPESVKFEVPRSFDPVINKGLEKAKVFNGKGIAYNEPKFIKRRDSKYHPDKWDGKDIHFARSASFNKGIKVNKNAKPRKNVGVIESIDKLRIGGYFTNPPTFFDKFISLLKSKEFTTAKEARVFLKGLGLSTNQARKVIIESSKQ